MVQIRAVRKNRQMHDQEITLPPRVLVPQRSEDIHLLLVFNFLFSYYEQLEFLQLNKNYYLLRKFLHFRY